MYSSPTTDFYLFTTETKRMRIGIITLFLAWTFSSFAGIHCPPDIEIDCNHDYYNLDFVGEATGFGNHINSTIRYVDVQNISACNVGSIQRIWYADVNNSGTFENNEPNCTQQIELQYIDHPFNVIFPADLYLDCEDDIPTQSPTWVSGPCDQVAYSVNEENFVGFSNACRVIQRRYTVINWCSYRPNDPSWNGEGIFEALQLIHLDDPSAPEINICETSEIEVEADCMVGISISKNAADLNSCGTGMLAWYISVDLWGDGIIEYEYSPEESGPFFLDKVSPDTDVTITIPKRVGPGRHKLIWKVVDFCGNVDNCLEEVYTVDNKAPTPYCLLSTQVVVTGTQKPVALSASSFDRGGFDNCSDISAISFSDDPSDSLRLLDCSDLGFQFSRVYYFDEAGNSDYCSVAYFVMDNGKCANATSTLSGRALSLAGMMMDDMIIEAKLEDEVLASTEIREEGMFNIGDIPLHEQLYFETTSISSANMEEVGVEDLVLMMDYVLGNLSQPFSEQQKWIGDVNDDGRLSARDIIDLKKIILLSEEAYSFNKYKLVAKKTYEQETFSAAADNRPRLIDYDGNLELLTIASGQVSHPQMMQNRLITDMPEKGIEVHIDDYQNTTNLVAQYDMSVDGIYIELTLAGDFNSEDISSDFIDVEQDISLENKEGNTIVKIAKGFLDAQNIIKNKGILSIKNNHNIIHSSITSRVVKRTEEGLEITPLVIHEKETTANDFSDVFISPNPGKSDQISIKIGDNISDFRIINSTGIVIENVLSLSTDNYTISNQLDRGIYFLQYKEADQWRAQKFIVL